MYKVVNIAPLQNKSNYNLDRLDDVSILIKTLERERHLKNLLYSIQRLGFKGPILIADDSKISYKDSILDAFPKLNIQYFVLPYDSGTSIGRNLLLQNTRTKYFVLCDDDFIFESRTRVPLMLKYLMKYKLDILGGVFWEYLPVKKWHYRWQKIFKKLLEYNWILPPPTFYMYHGNYIIIGDTCRLEAIAYRDPITACDFTHNFFIAKTESVLSFGGWNPDLKGGEHQNFFIRAKLKGLKIATTTKCGVIHDRWTPNSHEYLTLRLRGKNFQEYALSEFGIKHVENYEEVTGGFFGSTK